MSSGSPETSGLPPTFCTLAICTLDQSFLKYSPNLAGNALYLAIFAALFIAQTGLGIWYRTWGFLIGMFTGLFLEILGYAGRFVMRKNPFLIGNFLLYFIPLGIGPACLCTSIYLLLARITVLYGPSSSYLRPRTYAVVFCTLDVVALSIQGIGGGLTATADTPKSRDRSTYILIAGLVVQAASLAGFLTLAADVWRRVRQLREEDMNTDAEVTKLRHSKNWKRFLVALAVAAALVFVRTVYRVVELSGGFTGALANDEITFMIFEGPMIIIATFLLTVFHPGIIFRGGNWDRCDFPVLSKSGKEKKRRKIWGRKRAGVNSGESTMEENARDLDVEKLDDGYIAAMERQESIPEKPSKVVVM